MRQSRILMFDARQRPGKRLLTEWDIVQRATAKEKACQTLVLVHYILQKGPELQAFLLKGTIVHSVLHLEFHSRRVMRMTDEKLRHLIQDLRHEIKAMKHSLEDAEKRGIEMDAVMMVLIEKQHHALQHVIRSESSPAPFKLSKLEKHQMPTKKQLGLTTHRHRKVLKLHHA